MIENIERKILSGTLVAVFLYLSISIYSDLQTLFVVFQNFNWSILPKIICLILIGYFMRAYRWILYLQVLKIRIENKLSLLIFFSGLSMSITPAKSGEILKSYLLKEINKTNMSSSAPIIFVERLTDMIGMLILALFGFLSFNYGDSGLLSAAIIIFLIFFALYNKKTFHFLISLIDKIPIIGSRINFKEMYESSTRLLKPKLLFSAVFISTISWFLECICFYLILEGLGIDFSLIDATFIFAFSSIVGVLSMIPGGIGTTEGSILSLLILSEISKSLAAAAVLIVRVCTLWFAVVIGLVSLKFFYRFILLESNNSSISDV